MPLLISTILLLYFIYNTFKFNYHKEWKEFHPIISSNTGMKILKRQNAISILFSHTKIIEDLECERKHAIWNVNDIISQYRLYNSPREILLNNSKEMNFITLLIYLELLKKLQCIHIKASNTTEKVHLPIRYLYKWRIHNKGTHVSFFTF